LVFGTSQQGVELQCGVPQQTMMPQYGVGSVNQRNMQYSGSVSGQGGAELQYGAPQQTTNYTYGVPTSVAPQQEKIVKEVVAGEGNLVFGAPQQRVELQSGVPQQKLMPQYGVGSVKSMQYNASLARQGGVELQYGAPQQTTTYEYGVGAMPQKSVQYNGSVVGQGGNELQYGAPQQTTKYECGAPTAVVAQKETQLGVNLQCSVRQQTGVVQQRGMQNSGSVAGLGGVELQYGAPQQTTNSMAVAPQKEPQQGVKVQYSGVPQQTMPCEYGVGSVQQRGVQYSGSVARQGGVELQCATPQQTTKYEYGAAVAQTIERPAQVGMVVSENCSLPSETVSVGVPQQAVLTYEAPSYSVPVAETAVMTEITPCTLLERNVTITGPPWLIRAEAAPPPVLAVKVQPQS